MRPDEYAAVTELLTASGLPLDGLVEHRENILVARGDDAGVVGCAEIEVYEPVGLLRSLAVARDYRSVGLGARLTRAILELAPRLGVTEVYLLTETAESFFGVLGFKIVARKRVPARIRSTVEFSSACPETAAVMRMSVPQPAR
jgi:amino-acid N-acetyltransferase